MNCKNLGIGLISLSITLFLGVTVSEFLKLKDIPEIEVVEENIESLETESLKNCEPKDKDLKYQTLPNFENDSNYNDIDKDQKLILIPVPASSEKKDRKNDKSKSDTPKKDVPPDLEKNNSEEVFYLPGENTARYKTLLYEEICREKENGRK